MNYAICISGELRTGDLAWTKNLEYFRHTLDEYTFFFQTWDTNSNPKLQDSFLELVLNVFLGKVRRYESPEPVNAEAIKSLFQDFKNFNLKIRESEEWENEIPKILNLPQGRLGSKILGSMRMFFLIEKCDQQRMEFEKCHNVKFDGVLRIRPDSILLANPFELLKNSASDLIFFHDPNEERFLWGPVNDQVFVGTPEAMSKVTNVYSSLLRMGESLNWLLPPGEVHEVLVAESALSFHVRNLRTELKVNSSKIKTPLLRPKVITTRIPFEILQQRRKEFFKLSKHFLKQFFKHLIG